VLTIDSHGNARARNGILLVCALAVALCATRLQGYLLFHTLLELFTVAVAWSTFFLAWNARRFLNNDYLLLVGIAALFTGGLDAMHTLAYRGMGVFAGASADLPTQLWIAGRYLQGAALVLAPVFLRRRLRTSWTFICFVLAVAVVLVSIFTGIFPSCYREGSGLTGFKIASEYAVTAMLAASAVLLYRGRAAFDRAVLMQVCGSIILTIAAELAFTVYVDVYGAVNMAGHLLRFAAFCLMYRAIVVTGLVRPYALLFRDLLRSEEQLQTANSKLEGTIADRERLIAELQHALAEVKTLSGLLPICANCKSIRDDKGYWTQVEAYVGQHTDASFSHCICPECLAKLYPDYSGPRGAAADIPPSHGGE
jgi:hypothetical protein